MQVTYKNILVFLVGTAFNALGVTVTALTALGTSPSSTIPLVLNNVTGASLGIMVLVFQAVLFVMGIFVMGHSYRKIYIWALPVCVAFGLLCTAMGKACTSIHVSGVALEWTVFTAGMLFHTFGIALQLASNFSMTPPDQLVNFLSVRFNLDFALVKVAVNILFIIIAAVLSFILLGGLRGVAAGTFVAAVLDGVFVKMFTVILKRTHVYEWADHIEIEFDKDKRPKKAQAAQ